MRLFAVLVCGVAIFVALTSYGGAIGTRCIVGQAAAFASVRSDPPFLVGTIPADFTNDTNFFSRRFNCLGEGAQIRRKDLGTYDVRFPGLSGRLAVVTAISQEGVTASVDPLSGGIFRVSLRGPLGGSDVATRRDVPFSIVIY